LDQKLARKEENNANLWTRRDFLGFAGWAAFLSAIGVGLLSFLRMLYPRVLFEPSLKFKAGKITDYVLGVSEKFKAGQRTWIVRESDRLYAIQAICTHLGCTPRWLGTEKKFKCPCHGSGFTQQGINFEGPAPRPLERFKIGLDDEGNVVIDKGKKFLFEKGQWDDPESYIKV